MNEKKHKPIAVTPSFYQLGTRDFPAYLSVGDDAMLIEGGTGVTSTIIADQIKELGIAPERLKYIVLTHTHPDHIGALPYLKTLWSHLKVVASAIGAEVLRKPEMLKAFHRIDDSITQIQTAKGTISGPPPQVDGYAFEVDTIVNEGDRIELGSGIVWTVYATPGHSPCHISLYEESEETLVVGDATGYYVPEQDVFWPNYFQSLEVYCGSIRKLASILAKRAALCHNGIVDGDTRDYLEKAMRATEKYHTEVIRKLGEGEDFARIAEEKAKWVNSLTDIQPYEAIHDLSKLLLKRSQPVAGKEGLFVMPEKIAVPVRKDVRKG